MNDNIKKMFQPLFTIMVLKQMPENMLCSEKSLGGLEVMKVEDVAILS